MTSSATNLPPPGEDLLGGASLFLDFDGTLVDLVERHDAVQVESRLRQLLARLNEFLSGRLAIVSGRPVGDLQRLFGRLTFVVAGSHGLEMLWPDGRLEVKAARAFPGGYDSELADLAARHSGVVIERKPFGIAVHFRQAPQAEAECRRFGDELAVKYGLIVQPGKMVVELRAPGADKGTAVGALMLEPPMVHGRPVFLGDDETDEAGFAMARKMGGAGILVGAMRATAANYRLEGVQDVLNWLQNASEAAH